MALTSNHAPSGRAWPWRRRREPDPAPPAAPTRATPGARLIDVLDAKLAELKKLDYRILWMDISRADLVTLFIEGGEKAVTMDRDTSRDVAWFGAVEVRPSSKAMIWIYLEGEHPQISAHVV
jgi:hypothetical protein